MFQAVLVCLVAGLFARAAAQQCGEVLHAPSIFTSPNYPEPYSSNLECDWEIIAERGIRVSLEFLDSFTIESEVNCTKDAVLIHDWKDDNYVEIARLCGNNLPPKYESTFNKMKVILKTDKETNLRGFQARWTATCGGNYIATDKQQIIYSPGYPNYWPNMSCEYKIEVFHERIGFFTLNEEEGKKGIYKFLNFELENVAASSQECYNDYVKLESDEPDYYHKINERHCGVKTIPENYFIERLTLHFRSNEAIEKKGFVFAFSLYTCGGRIKEPTTITASHLNRYPDNLNCTWTIEAPQNKKIMVKFAYLNLNIAALCGKYEDYIKLYDGLLADEDNQLAAICGSTNSPLIIPALGNTMTFQFRSNREGRGFLAEVIFVDPEPIGCGGLINMTYFTSFTLESPNRRLKNPEEFIDCVWNILAPQDHIIKFQLTLLSLPECSNTSNLNVLEVRDGIVPDSLLLGSYCGKSLPLEISSSSNTLSVRLSAVVTAKFTAKLKTEKTLCKPVIVKVTRDLTRIPYPGTETGSFARGINCAYEFQTRNAPIHLIIKNINVQPSSSPAVCNKDKIIIGQRSSQKMLGKDYTTSNGEAFFMHTYSLFRKHFNFDNVNLTHQYEFCGSRDSIELYLSKSFFLNMITTPESFSSLADNGLEIQVTTPQFCTRNYTEPYGRIINNVYDPADSCYILLTAPEGYTISAYFMSYEPYFTEPSDLEYMDIYDGNTTLSKKITSTKGQVFKPYDVIQPVFSTGRYLLLHNIHTKYRDSIFDLNYVTTNRGRGCGGYLSGDLGAVSSPLYPDFYEEDNSCVFELETPPGTRLHLHFKELDAYGDCDNNFLEVVNRDGQVVKTLCEEYDYDYTSTDNYVKIVSETSKSGTKWFAMFASISVR